MNKNRKIEIEKEAQRRLNDWLLNSTFDEMSVNGSLMRFDMSLGLVNGYPFKKEKWMFNFTKFVTIKEYESLEYNEIINKLFETYNQNK
jgi:hypothetical protein